MDLGIDPNLASFVIYNQTMTHLFRSTVILVQAEPDYEILSLSLSPLYTYRESITEISMVAHWISPGRVHASVSQTRSPPMNSPINIHIPITNSLPPSVIHILVILHPRCLPPPSPGVVSDHRRSSRARRYVKGLAPRFFQVFLVDHLGLGLSDGSTAL